MTDILLNEQGDLRIEGGDLVVGGSTTQNQRLLLLIEKGALREFPLRGLGIASWLLREDGGGSLNAAVKREFEADGMKVNQVNVRAGALQIDAEYE